MSEDREKTYTAANPDAPPFDTGAMWREAEAAGWREKVAALQADLDAANERARGLEEFVQGIASHDITSPSCGLGCTEEIVCSAKDALAAAPSPPAAPLVENAEVVEDIHVAITVHEKSQNIISLRCRDNVQARAIARALMGGK